MLALGDLPRGWKVGPTPSDNGSPTASKCAKGLADLTETADVSSDFGQGPLEIPEVDSAVGMLETRAQAHALWRRVPTQQVLSCSVRSGAGLPKGARVSFRRLAFPRIGGRSVAWQFTIKTTLLPSPIYVDVAFASKGRTFSVLSLVNLGSPFDSSLARRLALTMSARLNRYGV